MIPYFIPDMPKTDQLLPYLREIDRNLWYSNFGPLYDEFRLGLAETLFSSVAPNRITLVSSGTSAIELALKSLGLPIGSKVLTSCFTFPATVEAITNVGLTPVLSDVDQGNWQLTPTIAESVISEQGIAAIIPVAAFGMPVCSESWAKFYNKTGIPVVVDAAAAIMNQSIHDDLIYAFSLHATKVIGVGEGGIIVCPIEEQAILTKKLSNFGIEADRTISVSGDNAKISEYHCAVGLAQLDRLNNIIEKRKRVFDYYINILSNEQLPITLQAGIDQFIPANVYILFNEFSTSSVYKSLARQGIETRRLYYPLISKHKGFKNILLANNGNQRNAIKISESGLALPFHMHLTNKEMDIIISKLAKLLLD